MKTTEVESEITCYGVGIDITQKVKKTGIVFHSQVEFGERVFEILAHDSKPDDLRELFLNSGERGYMLLLLTETKIGNYSSGTYERETKYRITKIFED